MVKRSMMRVMTTSWPSLPVLHRQVLHLWKRWSGGLTELKLKATYYHVSQHDWRKCTTLLQFCFFFFFKLMAAGGALEVKITALPGMALSPLCPRHFLPLSGHSHLCKKAGWAGPGSPIEALDCRSTSGSVANRVLMEQQDAFLRVQRQCVLWWCVWCGWEEEDERPRGGCVWLRGETIWLRKVIELLLGALNRPSLTRLSQGLDKRTDTMKRKKKEYIYIYINLLAL